VAPVRRACSSTQNGNAGSDDGRVPAAHPRSLLDQAARHDEILARPRHPPCRARARCRVHPCPPVSTAVPRRAPSFHQKYERFPSLPRETAFVLLIRWLQVQVLNGPLKIARVWRHTDVRRLRSARRTTGCHEYTRPRVHPIAPGAETLPFRAGRKPLRAVSGHSTSRSRAGLRHKTPRSSWETRSVRPRACCALLESWQREAGAR
jgi:hypothetical protein